MSELLSELSERRPWDPLAPDGGGQPEVDCYAKHERVRTDVKLLRQSADRRWRLFNSDDWVSYLNVALVVVAVFILQCLGIIGNPLRYVIQPSLVKEWGYRVNAMHVVFDKKDLRPFRGKSMVMVVTATDNRGRPKNDGQIVKSKLVDVPNATVGEVALDVDCSRISGLDPTDNYWCVTYVVSPDIDVSKFDGSGGYVIGRVSCQAELLWSTDETAGSPATLPSMAPPMHRTR